MVETVGTVTNFAKGIIPKVPGIAGSGLNYFAWLIIIVLIAAMIGVAIFVFIRQSKFNKKIVIFENIGGKWQPTRKDRAAEVKLSTSGDTIFYLLRHKKYLPTPSIQTGKRTYWYHIRSDGEWINFEMDDLDQEGKRMGARFLDKEMRYARTQIQKGLRERYDEPGFWKQYGIMVFSIAYITLIGVMAFLIFDQWIDLANATNAGVETAGVVMEKVNEVIGSLDNICSGGSGIRQT